MNDEWSLKGKERKLAEELIEYMFDDVFCTFDEVIEYTNEKEGISDTFIPHRKVIDLIYEFFNHEVLYSFRDIEMLRKTIIQDILEYIDKERKMPEKELEHVIKIINRRFFGEGG